MDFAPAVIACDMRVSAMHFKIIIMRMIDLIGFGKMPSKQLKT